MANLAEELKVRGLIHQSSVEDIEGFLNTRPRKVYLGLDPTADSLHVGHLVPILLLKRLSDAGHKPIFLVGGGTGMIGDPKEVGERPLLDTTTVRKNTRALAKQIRQLIGVRPTIVDNAKWLTNVKLLDFLRDVGKHFTVNELVKRDVIKRRLDTDNDSISFTEFSYSLLQAYDYWYLNKNYNVDLQIGGTDQWTNILSGVELIRKRTGKPVGAFTTPLVIDKTTGKKFGKSEGNAVWLDPKKTSPYAFYQFWLNISDPNVIDYLKIYTWIPLMKIEEYQARMQDFAVLQEAKRTLAWELTKLVHGETQARAAKSVSEVLFGSKDSKDLSRDEKDVLLKEAPGVKITKYELASGISIPDLMLKANLVTSKNEAKSLIEGKGVTLNGASITSPFQTLAASDLSQGFALLRKGKKDYACVSLGR